jgi:DNA modification methylase
VAAYSIKHSPGVVRDAIFDFLSDQPNGARVQEIAAAVYRNIGDTPRSSVQSYLRLNTGELFDQPSRGHYQLRKEIVETRRPLAGHKFNGPSFKYEKASLHQGDCFKWLDHQPANSIHAVVTDPPYGLLEYSEAEQRKLRAGRGGVWRLPPSFDGNKRSPLPRFTTLTDLDKQALANFFFDWATRLLPVLVPGANVLLASNPLLSHIVSNALARGGLERRGEIIRLVMTMRGGDRPKAAHVEFSEISVMPRSMWEPWLVFRKPIEGRVQDNLRKWHTGGFRRPDKDKPFGDVIRSAPTRKEERSLAPHPSLKPQAFLRHIVRAVLPRGIGIIVDPFAGAASTLAAANAVDYDSIGVEKDPNYFEVAQKALPRLSKFKA